MKLGESLVKDRRQPRRSREDYEEVYGGFCWREGPRTEVRKGRSSGRGGVVVVCGRGGGDTLLKFGEWSLRVGVVEVSRGDKWVRWCVLV